MLNTNESAVTTGEYVIELVYELLDAHADTTRIARDIYDDPTWAAHLDYLRDLQRIGREALAEIARASASASPAQGRSGRAPEPTRARSSVLPVRRRRNQA